jgi:HAMP domain-containing protein
VVFQLACQRFVFFQIQRTTIVTHIVYISVAKGTQQTMPVDPFSIAGVFGLAAGLIGFTVSTIEKSAGQLNTARQAHQRLRGHWEALKTCQQRLEAWERQWYDHEKLEQDDLNFLWDREGVQAVDSKRAVLLDEQGELLKLLYNGEGSESRSRETSSWWSKVFRDLDMAMRSGVPGPDPPSDGKLKDFSIRVAMALWRNNNLSASVGRLRGLVEDLERTSVLCFHKAQRSTGQITQPSQEEVEGLIQQRRRMRHLIEALLSVYHGVRRQSDPCELLLTSFDELEICQLRTHHELTVSFLLVCMFLCD